MLNLEHLEKSFLKGTPNAHKALDGIDLTLSDGEFVTVIGSNGAGKGAVAGSFQCDAGRILLDGRAYGALSE